MREMKAFASLTSGLLARKGAARPAMRPMDPAQAGLVPVAVDDLGWNDMGEGEPVPRRPAGVRLPATLSGAPETPVAITIPEVMRQQDEIAREFAPLSAVAAATLAPLSLPLPLPRSAGRKAAFTLRLDAERHLRLRLACAVDGRSAQQIVTAALDTVLAGRPDIDRLAAQLPSAPVAGEDR